MTTRPDDLETAPGSPAGGLGGAQIALAVLATLFVLFLVWFVFLRPDAEPDVAAPAPAPATTEDPVDPEPDVSPTPSRRRPVETFEVFAPKDPFDPLISASAGGDASGADATAEGGTTETGDGTSGDGTGTTTTDGTGTTTTTTTSGGGGGNGRGENVDGHRVRVIDVFREGGDRRAQIQVDGTVYTVDEGERFAENFELMSTSGQCATMLYGDDEFTLCEGEEILK